MGIVALGEKVAERQLFRSGHSEFLRHIQGGYGMKGMLTHVVSLIVVALLLTGCAGLGIRPSEPEYTTGISNTACDEFATYADYTRKLREAYLSRATQNRFWIYASGTTALSTVAATAAIAAASTPSGGTIAIVSLGGGLLSGVFAMADNPTLADIYTIATNNLNNSLKEADAELKLNGTGNRFGDQQACAAALQKLRSGVTEATNNLERARTDSAVASVQRAAAQTKRLTDLAKQVQEEQATSRVAESGVIMSVEPDTITGTAEITLTVVGLTPAMCRQDTMKVSIGDKTPEGKCSPLDERTGVYAVRFTAPGKPPFSKQTEYGPALLIGTGGKKVETRAGVVLRYAK